MRGFFLGAALLVVLASGGRAGAEDAGGGTAGGPYFGHEIHARWQRSSCGSPAFRGVASSVVVQRAEDSRALAAQGGASHCRSASGWDSQGWGPPPIVIDVDARRPRIR